LARRTGTTSARRIRGQGSTVIEYLLDTNACIQLLRGRSPSLEARAMREGISRIAICFVVLSELLYVSSGAPLHGERRTGSLWWNDIACSDLCHSTIWRRKNARRSERFGPERGSRLARTTR
jgi:predicted nucleic acid-binding protein